MWIIPHENGGGTKHTKMWAWIQEKMIISFRDLSEAHTEALVLSAVRRLRESAIYSPSVADLCIAVAEAAFKYSGGASAVLAYVLTELWTVVAAFAEGSTHASAALLASLLRCREQFLDASVSTAAAVACDQATNQTETRIGRGTSWVVSGTQVLKQILWLSRVTVSETVLFMQVYRDLQLSALWIMGEYSNLWIDTNAALTTFSYEYCMCDGSSILDNSHSSAVLLLSAVLDGLWNSSGVSQTVSLEALYKIASRFPSNCGLVSYIRHEINACGVAAIGFEQHLPGISLRLR
jgi:hypothetical protein